MRQYCAVIGRTLTCEEFHQDILGHSSVGHVALQSFLKSRGLALSRQEVSELIYLFSRGVNGSLSSLRTACSFGDRECSENFWVTLGLACIDGEFRTRLGRAARQGAGAFRRQLDGELASEDPPLPVSETPISSDEATSEYEELRRVFASFGALALMDDVQKNGWWHQQMVFGACPQGYYFRDRLYSAPTTGEQADVVRTGGSLAELVTRKREEIRFEMHRHEVESDSEPIEGDG